MVNGWGEREFVGGPEWKDPARIPENVDRLIIFNEYPDVAGRRRFGTSPKLRFCRMWDEVFALLGEKHGTGTRAVVYPNADIQSSYLPMAALVAVFMAILAAILTANLAAILMANLAAILMANLAAILIAALVPVLPADLSISGGRL